MPAATIAVFASFRLPVAALARARALLPDLITATRGEAGCLVYDVGQDVLDPGLFRVSELWAAKAYLEAHLKTPHMAAWNQARAEMGMTERQLRMFEVSGEASL